MNGEHSNTQASVSTDLQFTRVERLTYDLLYQSSGHFREFVDQRRMYGYPPRVIWNDYSELMDGNENHSQARF